MTWQHIYSTINVHLHHDHRFHGLVGDPDHSRASLSLMMSGPIGLKRQSLAWSLLIWLASDMRGLALSFSCRSPIGCHGHCRPQIYLRGKKKSHLFQLDPILTQHCDINLENITISDLEKLFKAF